VTLRNAPLPGQDGDECTTDLISEKQKYFFDWGWTRQNAPAERDLPDGQTTGSVGWVERFAKPISLSNMMGLASAFRLRSASFGGTRSSLVAMADRSLKPSYN
jgi:hypothetical protein